ncbi:hypothetical protein RB195_018119 [Necator americanus]|uniref:Uncharacterized protein n=1 Tax=Necator americanus TaxID=51031 RepID=A0ABR1C895_NECAM
METAEDNSKDAFYDELNPLVSKISSQWSLSQSKNAKMGLEQQSNVLGKWYYLAERTSDNGHRLWSTCANRRSSSSLPRLRGIIDAISSRGRGQPF